MRNRPLPVLAALLLIGALGLAACGGSSNNGGGGGGNAKTLTYWASNQAPTLQDDQKILKPELDKFTKQSGVQVNLEVIPWTDLYKRILTATSSGEGPDVLNIGNTWSASLQATGAFLDFDDATLSKVGGKGKFFPTSFSATGAPGKTPTSVPLYGLAYGLFYNQKMFKQAGIAKPPTTWPQFLDDAKKLTKPPNQWGLAIEGSSITENSHWGFLLGRQQGGSLFEGDKPTFDSPQQVAGVTQFVNFVAKDKIVSPSNVEYSTGTQALTDFAKGRAAMVLWQNNAAATLKSLGMTDKEYGVGPMPVPDPMPPGGRPTQSHVAGINLSIFKNTKNKDAALQLVNFLTSKDEQVILNKAFQSLPVINDAYSDPAFKTPFIQNFKNVLANHSEPMPLIAQEGEMETIIGGTIKQLLAKAATGNVSEADVKSALTAANSQMAAAG
jgi:multiple sugar transport system substrate-binding protein